MTRDESNIILKRFIFLFFLSSGLTACFSELPEKDRSLSKTKNDQDTIVSLGPKVEYLPLHKPFPLGPFPNDSATRYGLLLKSLDVVK